jgi:hypothetical protein
VSKIDEINKIYSNFRKQFNRENCPDLFAAIDKVYEDLDHKHFPHKLGHFAILYTPIPKQDRPKIMLLGNNPSWFVFIRKNKVPSSFEKELAENIVREMGNGIPLRSSYCDHDHKFARRIRNIFNNAGLIETLPHVVGMNWFWVQTGSNPYELRDVCLGDVNANRKKNEQLGDIMNHCRMGTEKIINLLSPQSLFVLGDDAKKEVRKMQIDENIITRYVAHPDRRNDLEQKLIELKNDDTH